MPGLGSDLAVAQLTPCDPAELVAEIAFPNSPIDTAGFFNQVLADNPTSYWRMNDTATLVDEGGSGNTMTLANTPTLVTGALSADPDQALSFNGTDEDGSAADSVSLSPTGVMSELFYVNRATAPASTEFIAGKGRSYWAELRTDGKVQFSVRKDSTVTTVVSSVSVVGAFHLVHCVYDGTTLRLLIDGALDTSVAYSAGISPSPGVPFTVARADDSTASPTYRDQRRSGLSGGSTSLGAQTPAGTVAGDYMLASLRLPNAAGSPSVPAGWTLLGAVGVSNLFAETLYVYGKVASAGDAAGGATYTWTWGTTTSSADLYLVAAANVSGVGAVGGNAVVSTSISLSFTPEYANTLAVVFFGGEDNGAYTVAPGTKQNDNNHGVCFETFAVGAPTAQSISGSTATSGGKMVIAVELIGPIGTVSHSAVAVDEVALWNGTALSDAQAAAHFAAAAVAPSTVVWTDISADVIEWSTDRGEQYELDRMQAGTLRLLLADDRRDYDPANELSPHWPNVKPMRQIRIRALLNGTYFPIYKGFVERWQSRWEPGYVDRYAELSLTATDGFEPLSLAVVEGTIPSGLAGASIANLISRANWPSAQRQLDDGQLNVEAIVMDGSTNVLSYVLDVAEGEGGKFFISAAGDAVFHDKRHRIESSLSNFPQALFSDVPDGGLPYTALVPSFDKDHIVNDWTVSDSTGAAHQVEDTDSINAYFRRSQSRSSFLSATDAADMAAYLLDKTKDPGYRLETLELTPHRTLELWQQALSREIGDRITVHRQAVGKAPGSQLARDFWIERIQWTMPRDGMPWTVQWTLSPAT